MKFWSNSFKNGARIPDQLCFGKWNPDTKIELSDNLNPHFAWSDLPRETKSLALICCDPDVPSRPDDVNQEGKTVSASLPRVNFYHWAVCNLSPTLNEISEGQFSKGVTAKGKAGPAALLNSHQGINNYREWFSGDADMSGNYFGYDGPCPPWNDEILHHYQFTLYALNVESLNVGDLSSCLEIEDLAKKHSIAQATYIGTYSINPNVK